jgi:hypothetical protein
MEMRAEERNDVLAGVATTPRADVAVEQLPDDSARSQCHRPTDWIARKPDAREVLLASRRLTASASNHRDSVCYPSSEPMSRG